MTLTEANKPQTSKNSVLASGFQLFSTRHWLVNKLNLTKLVSVFLQRRQTQTLFSQCLCGSIMSLGTWCSAPLQIYICIKKKSLFTFHCVTPKQVTEHVIMLKEIFDRQDSIFWKHTSIFLWNMYNKTWTSKWNHAQIRAAL